MKFQLKCNENRKIRKEITNKGDTKNYGWTNEPSGHKYR